MHMHSGSRKQALDAPPAQQGPAANDAGDELGGTRERLLKTATEEFADKGYSGARIQTIARRAATNMRMIYHYFGSKEDLYIEVLEQALDRLRHDELRFESDNEAPAQGMARIFDFIHGHFGEHPELMKLLSAENLNRARYMKRSRRIPERASPVIAAIQGLLRRGAADGSFRADVDALHLYITMVSLAYFHRSNAHTLSMIFQRDLLDAAWQREHREQARQMVFCYLAPCAA